MTRKTNSFTLVEIIAVLLIIAIMAAVAAPKFISLADEARIGVAQAGLNEAKATLSVAYAKAYLTVNKGVATPTRPTAKDVLDAAGFATAVAETFGDVSVTMTGTALDFAIEIDAAYDTDTTVSDTWDIPEL